MNESKVAIRCGEHAFTRFQKLLPQQDRLLPKIYQTTDDQYIIYWDNIYWYETYNSNEAEIVKAFGQAFDYLEKRPFDQNGDLLPGYEFEFLKFETDSSDYQYRSNDWEVRICMEKSIRLPENLKELSPETGEETNTYVVAFLSGNTPCINLAIAKTKEKVKLDEILKYLFSTSNKVLVKLLNAIFEEDFKEYEVNLTVSNNEFIEDTLGVIRGDMFFDILKRDNNKVSYHLEFQTKNDNTMVIRMFEYGFKKAKENSNIDNSMRTLYFPKQKVIFFEENKNIEDLLNLKIIFPNNQEVIYCVDVIKYWEFTEEELIKRKMYPLIPLQLFSLRKELEVAQKKNDILKIQQLSVIAKNLATKLANESKELFCENEILGEDFHKMLLAIQNLIEYLNRNYFNDDKLEEEVITMTKSLYDPEVEKQGIQKGIQKGIEQGIKQGIKQGEKKKSIEIAKKGILKGLDNETIMDLTELSIEEIELIRKEMSLN